MTKRAALYLRVSTDKQTVANQREALTAIATQRGWQIVSEYNDAGISGAKGRDGRPGLDKALKDATRARYNVLMVWAIDRLGRSLQDLLATMQTLEAVKVDLFIDRRALDNTTPTGKLMFQMCGAFAEFERAMIVQRVNAGLARAHKAGVRLGRPGGSGRKAG
jgi:DNA invertase Pin-like site-specific DNA recombinase